MTDDITCPQCEQVALNPGPEGDRPRECKACGFVLPATRTRGVWEDVQLPQVFDSEDDEDDEDDEDG